MHSGLSDLGRALLAHTTNNEQGFTFRTHDHAWHPADHEGLTLIRRPSANRTQLQAAQSQGGAQRRSAPFRRRKEMKCTMCRNR
ncbi:type I-E CRISPR-associated endoribonuclease Cas2 [Streptomyces parvus]|uniref:type I-E CRISPR-associated endoribonuclease Cas2 n=1 Tax=Streptomyces parvus TaxID=66428 RepID=UPI003F4ECA3D